MTEAVQEAFEIIYGERGATSLPVSSWDLKFSTFKFGVIFGVKAGRESMREEAIQIAENYRFDNSALMSNPPQSGAVYGILGDLKRIKL